MGQIGRFIDHCCEHHPQLMRAVLERELSPLSEFIAFDDNGRACGCLIGTCMLAIGYQRAYAIDHTFTYGSRNVTRADDWSISPGFYRLAEALGDDIYTGRYNAYRLSELGRAVFEVSCRFAGQPRRRQRKRTDGTADSDARVVHLLRTRIARQLAIRESAMPLGAVLPGEPSESEMCRVS